MKIVTMTAALLLFAIHASGQIDLKKEIAETVAPISNAQETEPTTTETEVAPPSEMSEAESLRARAELRKKISDLTQQRDRMLIEIKAIEREITALKTQAAQLDPDRKATTESDQDDKSAKSKRQTHRTMVSMLTGMPADARPSGRDGWNMFNLEIAKKWLNDERAGDDINMRVTIGSIQVARNDSKIDEVIGSGDWIVTFTVRASPFRYVTTQNDLAIVSSAADGKDQFTLKVDEAYARRASQLKTGDIINIEGRIDSIEMTGNAQRASFKLAIRNAGIAGYDD